MNKFENNQIKRLETVDLKIDESYDIAKGNEKEVVNFRKQIKNIKHEANQLSDNFSEFQKKTTSTIVENSKLFHNRLQKISDEFYVEKEIINENKINISELKNQATTQEMDINDHGLMCKKYGIMLDKLEYTRATREELHK